MTTLSESDKAKLIERVLSNWKEKARQKVIQAEIEEAKLVATLQVHERFDTLPEFGPGGEKSGLRRQIDSARNALGERIDEFNNRSLVHEYALETFLNKINTP